LRNEFYIQKRRLGVVLGKIKCTALNILVGFLAEAVYVQALCWYSETVIHGLLERVVQASREIRKNVIIVQKYRCEIDGIYVVQLYTVEERYWSRSLDILGRVPIGVP
jgi:hypothetical protein